MTLGELIKALEAANPDLVVPHGFGKPHSYRGYYDELAFEPRENVTVRRMLEDARSALGATYHGWKGGEFTMREYTECHLAVEGDTGEGIGPVLLRYMLAAGAVAALAVAALAELASSWEEPLKMATATHDELIEQRARLECARELRAGLEQAFPS